MFSTTSSGPERLSTLQPLMRPQNIGVATGDPGAPKILYIAGTMHCGSTIVDILLGQHHHIFSAGEVVDADWFFQEDLSVNNYRVNRVPFWKTFAYNLPLSERGKLKKVKHLVSKEKGLVKFLLSHAASKEYLAANRQIFDYICAAAPNVQVIVDSSKSLSRAIALRNMEGYEVYVIHLTRNLRGFLNSKLKQRAARYSTMQVIGHTWTWILKNTLASLILPRLYRNRLHRLRYEDLTGDPDIELNKIGDFIGLIFTADFLIYLQEDELSIPQLIGGNRIRKQSKIKFNPHKTKNIELDKKTFWIQFLFGGFLSFFWGYSIFK